MKTIIIPEREVFDGRSGEFIAYPSVRLDIEHNLIAVSKWEMKWKKPFLTDAPKTPEETIDYVKCMTLNDNVPDDAYNRLTRSNIKEIEEYLSQPMTATTINRRGKRGNKRVVTSELIYCWMIELGIPKEFEEWPLQRLMVLIEVCSIESQPKQKMSKKDQANLYRSQNAARRARTGSKG